MKIIRNKYKWIPIPFPTYKAINICGVLIVRGNARIDDVTLNHEEIHTAQIKEMLYLFFYIWYGIEWFIKFLKYWNSHKAYKNISFERESYANQNDLTYLKTRRRFSWIKHLT